MDELKETVMKKNMVIDGLESEVKKEKEKAQIKISVFQKTEKQLKLELANKDEIISCLKKDLAEKDKQITQEKKNLTSMQEKFNKCDAQRSTNQKELTKSKTTCQAVSTRNSRLEGELRELKCNHSTMSRQHETLQKTLAAKDGTISELNTKIQELQIRVESHREANRRILESTDGAVSGTTNSGEAQLNDEIEIEVCEDDVFANSSSSEDRVSLQKNWQKKLNEKTAEIRSLKSVINELETTISDLQDEKRTITEENYASGVELARLREINTLLLGQQNENTPPSMSRDNSDTDLATITEVNQPNNEEISSEDSISSAQTSSEEVCHLAWYDGIEACDGSCGQSHRIDFTKLARGICYHEFAERNSCTWGENCHFCHNIPVIALTDPIVIETVENSKRRKRQMSSRRQNRTDHNYSNHTSQNHSVHSPRVRNGANSPPPLMSVVTGYQQAEQDHNYTNLNSSNTHLSANTHVSEPEIANSFLGHYIAQVIALELNRRLVQPARSPLPAGVETPQRIPRQHYQSIM